MKRKRHNIYTIKGHYLTRGVHNGYFVSRCTCGWRSSARTERDTELCERWHWMFVTGLNHDKRELVM